MATNFETKWESLGLSNDFIFSKVMREPQICKEVLERILDIEIDHIEYPETQKTILGEYDTKSVRLDVYVRDEENTIYNCEMQATDQHNLPLRARYYQTMIDLDDLDRGGVYSKLNPSFVIFICTFDPFKTKDHLHRYTFISRCEEDPNLTLGDKRSYVFLNTEGMVDDVSPKLKTFLEFVAGRDAQDDFIMELKERVERVKQSKDARREYMTFELKMQDARQEGLETAVFSFVQKGTISPAAGAEELSLSLEEFTKKMTENGYQLPKEYSK